MPKLGTIEWAKKTHGTLSTADKLAMLKQEMQRQFIQMRKRFAETEIVQIDRVDLDKIIIPDSHIAVASLEVLESCAPKSLLHHCLRTYYWGCILAMQDSLTYDAELFYLMSLWHDMGLCKPYRFQDGVSKCFAVEGGRAAKEFITLHGTSSQAAEVEAAITNHLNLFVPPEEGIENHLLPSATALDVVGARSSELKPEVIATVLEKYPRLTFKDDLIGLFNREYDKRPDSRIAFMNQVGGLNRMIRKAPFES